MFRAGWCVGRCHWDGSGVLLCELLVGCLHVFASRQSVFRCSCGLREVLVEEAVLRPFESCRKGVWCAPLWCRTRIWGRVTYTTVMEAPTRSMVWIFFALVYGVDGALGVMVEVPAEDR